MMDLVRPSVMIGDGQKKWWVFWVFFKVYVIGCFQTSCSTISVSVSRLELIVLRR